MGVVLDLIESINTADEKTLWKMLDTEKKGAARPYLMSRIYGRVAKLRAERERVEMAQATVARQ